MEKYRGQSFFHMEISHLESTDTEPSTVGRLDLITTKQDMIPTPLRSKTLGINCGKEQPCGYPSVFVAATHSFHMVHPV